MQNMQLSTCRLLEIGQRYTDKAIYSSEMEKRADGADASVLFFLRGCANVLAVYAQIR